MRLADALDRFVVQLEADGRSPHTIAQYRRHIALLGRWLAREGHDDDVDALSHELLARFLVAPDARVSRLGGSKRASSVNALRSSLKTFLSYVHDAGWSRNNAGRLIRRARCGAPHRRSLDKGDQQRLLATLSSARGRAARRDHALIILMLGTGVRLSAALGLRCEDIDVERGEAVVHNCKGDRTESVVISEALCRVLREYIKDRKRDYLFVGCNGAPISRRHAARRLGLWLQRAGCRQASPHSLRRAFGTRVYEATHDLLLTKAALHHRAISSTLAYVEHDARRLRATLATL